MKKEIRFLAVLFTMLAVGSSAWAMAKKPANEGSTVTKLEIKDMAAANRTSAFYGCLSDVTFNQCKTLSVDWNDPAQKAAYETCYAKGRAKCGCDFQIAAECK